MSDNRDPGALARTAISRWLEGGCLEAAIRTAIVIGQAVERERLRESIREEYAEKLDAFDADEKAQRLLSRVWAKEDEG